MASVVFPNNFILRLFIAVFCPPGANHKPWLMRRAGFVSHEVMIGSGVREHWPLCANQCNSVTLVFHLRKRIKWIWMDKISPRDRKTWQVSGYEIPEMHLLIRLHSQADPIQPWICTHKEKRLLLPVNEACEPLHSSCQGLNTRGRVGALCNSTPPVLGKWVYFSMEKINIKSQHRQQRQDVYIAVSGSKEVLDSPLRLVLD